MAIYNMSAVEESSNTLYDLAFQINSIEPLIGSMIIIGVFSLMFLALSTRFSFEGSMLASLWISSLLGIYLSQAGLFPGAFTIILIGGTALMAAYYIFRN